MLAGDLPRLLMLVCSALIAICVDGPADAQTETSTAAGSSAVEAPAGEDDKDPSRLELGLLPAINFDSDTGFGFGVIANLAQFEPDASPYAWRVSAQAYASVKDGPEGAEFPLQHHYIKLDVPQFLDDTVRLRVVGRFRRQVNTGYYGLGNASKDDVSIDDFDADTMPVEHERAFRFNQYDRFFPQLRADLQLELFGDVEAFAGVGITWNWVSSYAGSKLEADTSDLVGVGRHGVIDTQLGLLFDTRDNETAPQTGMFHELSLRGAKLAERSGGYGGANLTLRVYQSIYEAYLVVAARVMTDLQWGDVPVYELAEHGGLFPEAAIAGGQAIRGPPGQRYHGKIKLLGNVELRSKLVDFILFDNHFNLGLIGFFDTGRIWADYSTDELLDGTGVGLEYGAGGGLRIQWGETFVIRGDVGWSPDGLGIYININHIF